MNQIIMMETNYAILYFHFCYLFIYFVVVVFLCACDSRLVIFKVACLLNETVTLQVKVLMVFFFYSSM